MKSEEGAVLGMSVVGWEDPSGVTGLTWLEEAAELRANPGRWGVLEHPRGPWPSAQVAYNASQSVKLGKYGAFRPEGSFESTTRQVDGCPRLYARFVGGS